MPPKARAKRHSRSTRAGIIFPVARIHRFLKSSPTTTTRITQGASVYLASVIEYLVGMYTYPMMFIEHNSCFSFSGIT